MRTRIGKQFRFEASHRLPLHDGKCRRPHGHSYRVEVSFLGEPEARGPKTGMVIDFGEISRVWKEELEPILDHRDLNVELKGLAATTAELIALWIFLRLREKFGQTVERVRVWETATSWAEVPA